MKICILAFGLFFSIGLWAQSGNQNKELTEAQKIDFLISKVENLENAEFVRNGTSYDSHTAANHLQMKREKAGTHIKTVDEFIEKVASKSSVTGEAYIIKYSDGTEITAAEFYSRSLKELEESRQRN